MLRNSIRIAAMIASAGAASTAMASASATPTDVITWGGVGTGRSLAGAQPSGLTWSWNASRSTGVVIDSNGRVYWQGQYTQSPPVGTIAGASHRALFTATNSTDTAVFDGIYDGGTKDGLNIRNAASSLGGVSTTSPRVAGTKVGFGLQFSGGSPAILETGVGQNNTGIYVGDYASGTSRTMQQSDSVTLNAVGNVATAGLTNVNLRSISQQNSEINSSGSLVAWLAVPAAAGVFTTGATGNNAFLGLKTGAGAYSVVAQGGTSAPGVAGGIFQNGSNGVNGFFSKINRSGQVGFTGKLVNNFPVTAGSDDVAYIHTPGSGNTLVYREGRIAPDASGADDAGGALFSGSISTGRSFSEAGLMYTATLTGGDVTTTAGSANDMGMYISTTTGTTRVFRKNDPVPGMPAGVNFGNVGAANFNINNSGRVSFGNFMQGPGVITTANAQLAGFPPTSVLTPGVMGNDVAIITGPANNLQVIARSGDLAPGMGGLHHKITANNGSLLMNNNGDILFQSDTTPYAAGESIGVAGGPLSSILADGPTVLWGWTQSYGLLPMFYTGQQIEVETGVFKSIVQMTVTNPDNGDGGSSGLNDNGEFVVSLLFADNTWGYVKAQIPAPGTGVMSVLGLGVLARRRRR